MPTVEPALPGVLTDTDISAEAKAGRLISENFSQRSVQQACYELRAGNIYYDLSHGSERLVLGQPEQYILIKPHQQVVIITFETLDVPADIIGRIMMKGKLFSLGLQPISTYADPGFSGKLGIVIYNSSPNYIRIDQGAPIAKIEFERLSRPVAKPYAGQHGYQSEIWPIPTHLILSEAEIVADGRVSDVAEEIRRAYGKNVAGVIERVFRYERLLLLSAIAYMFLATTIIVFSGVSRLSTLSAFLIGLVTNIVSTVLIFAATNFRRR